MPLWAEAIGLDAATTSLIFGLSAGVDMLLFYPGGAVMDRFGRVWVAVPAMIVLGLGFGLLPLTHSATTLGLVAATMGLGNGISAGVVMTLGADASPADARAQFLAGWRACSDLGNAAGPLVISVVSAVAPLAVAAVTMGLLTWAGSGWLLKWVPAYAGPVVRRRPDDPPDRGDQRARRVQERRRPPGSRISRATGGDGDRIHQQRAAGRANAPGTLNVLPVEEEPRVKPPTCSQSSVLTARHAPVNQGTHEIAASNQLPSNGTVPSGRKMRGANRVIGWIAACAAGRRKLSGSMLASGLSNTHWVAPIAAASRTPRFAPAPKSSLSLAARSANPPARPGRAPSRSTASR